MYKSKQYNKDENRLIEAIKGNDARKIADMCEVNSNLMNNMKNNVLFIVAVSEGIEANTIATLIEFGANPLAKDPEFKYTCLHLTAHRNPKYVIDILGIYYGLLLDNKGLDEVTAKKKLAEFINIPNNDGYTVIHHVLGLDDKNTELRQFLLKHGGDINARDNDGETVAHMCIKQITESGERAKRDPVQMEYDRFVIIERFVEEGLDPTIKDNSGRTVLDSISEKYRNRIKAQASKSSMAEKVVASRYNSNEGYDSDTSSMAAKVKASRYNCTCMIL
ncbi:MAG: ankyrin repeat domain-containing protein [Rickettsiales bacterium]|nr:MAG: ankyrin repeat domain-containing protein [Rickettsiales bacterium]